MQSLHRRAGKLQTGCHAEESLRADLRVLQGGDEGRLALRLPVQGPPGCVVNWRRPGTRQGTSRKVSTSDSYQLLRKEMIERLRTLTVCSRFFRCRDDEIMGLCRKALIMSCCVIYL